MSGDSMAPFFIHNLYKSETSLFPLLSLFIFSSTVCL